jgi:2-methylisocitrate lyase-like PEP mutase family enzyme
MTANELRDKADRLRALHAGPKILVLCNVWDAASARIVEHAGFPAIATTSAGIANSLGYPDGQRISRAEMLDAVARIARSVSVPVSADLESGYGRAPEAAAETARAAIAAGAVGLNLEDALDEREFFDIALQCDRVRAACQAARDAGVPLVVNARTDVYLAGSGSPDDQFAEAVRRANAYREAGADCLFVPGVSDAAVIARLVREIHGPINILAGPATPPVPELEKLGVRRVSMGSGPMRATMALTQKIARELAQSGSYASFTRDTISYRQANQLLSSEQSSA